MGKSQTATNFNVNDCSSVNHDLFSELNSGKVIVLCWVMPCSACLGPALSVDAEVQNYQTSNPNKVFFYLVDDYANTNCSSLNSWASTNGITPDASFSNAAIDMNDYGGAGMPKTVVLGGASHTVFDNQNNTLNVTQFNAAIAQALLASAIGINEVKQSKATVSVFPNPIVGDQFIISFNLTEGGMVTIEIFNLLGAKVKEVLSENQTSGNHKVNLGTELKNGSYFLKIKTGTTELSSKLVINR